MHEVFALDDTGMACQVTATSAGHGYRLVTDYLTDPARDSVVMHTSYEPLTESARGTTCTFGITP